MRGGGTEGLAASMTQRRLSLWPEETGGRIVLWCRPHCPLVQMNVGTPGGRGTLAARSAARWRSTQGEGIEAWSCSATRTRSASVATSIFCITSARWALTVRSEVPSSAAISLFSLPATTRANTERSRGLKESNRARSALGRLRPRGFPHHEPGAADCVQECFLLHGFRQEIHGAIFHRAYTHRDVAVAGQENDGKCVRTLSDRVLQVQTTRSRHADVQNDATRRVGLPREKEVAR